MTFCCNLLEATRAPLVSSCGASLFAGVRTKTLEAGPARSPRPHAHRSPLPTSAARDAVSRMGGRTVSPIPQHERALWGVRQLCVASRSQVYRQTMHIIQTYRHIAELKPFRMCQAVLGQLSQITASQCLRRLSALRTPIRARGMHCFALRRGRDGVSARRTECQMSGQTVGAGTERAAQRSSVQRDRPASHTRTRVQGARFIIRQEGDPACGPCAPAGPGGLALQLPFPSRYISNAYLAARASPSVRSPIASCDGRRPASTTGHRCGSRWRRALCAALHELASRRARRAGRAAGGR